MIELPARGRHLWLLAILLTLFPLIAQAKFSAWPNPRYVPIEVPLAQTAILVTYDDRGPPGLSNWIERIDGEKYKGYRGYQNNGFMVRLLPGRHRVGIAYMTFGGMENRRGSPDVEVELEAGKIYIVRVVALVGDDIAVRVEEFVPGTPYRFPAGAHRDSSLEGLFIEGRDPQEAKRRKKAGLPPRPSAE